LLLLAGLLAISITALRSHADRARKVQLAVTELKAATERLSRLEWQAAASGHVAPPLAEESQRVSRHLHRLVHAYPDDLESLVTETHFYLAAVGRELSFLTAGRVAESEAVDQRDVDPSFERLQRGLGVIEAAQSKRARRASLNTDIGITLSLLLAALAMILLLRRLDALRTSTGLRRERDLEAQALHDALTGLPNRRKLLHDLEAAVKSEPRDDRVLLLCDLDGFKDYNDTFGHAEGDLLLCRLSAQLAETLAPYGTAYRLGGDEFCAILRVNPDALEPALAACHGALTERGRGFDIHASVGCVVLPAEASDATTALRVAGQRMLAEKNERGSWVTQLRDLILRVLSEQDPELYAHVHHVGRLAERIGRRLGLSDAEVQMLVRAAELHDVGKVAIPNSILQKPGPLDASEREFLERHTLIGESILSAAPMLDGVGRLVRSSHERYDGNGYPDGLRAEQIPLASRIIFVCDSFHAMTTDRPYRRAISDGAALAELGRCAASQFDPVVVKAFMTEIDETERRRQARIRLTPEFA
jgi:diguanylate cyclase (GGDEF)-like protein